MFQADRRTEGRTDMTKLTVSFRNFANARKNCLTENSKLSLSSPHELWINNIKLTTSSLQTYRNRPNDHFLVTTACISVRPCHSLSCAQFFQWNIMARIKHLLSVNCVMELSERSAPAFTVYKLYDPDWPVGNNYNHMPCLPSALIPPPAAFDNPDQASHYHIFNMVGTGRGSSMIRNVSCNTVSICFLCCWDHYDEVLDRNGTNQAQ